MKPGTAFFFGTLMSLSSLPPSTPAEINGAPLHVTSRFQFTLGASVLIAAPLFGPERERCWAGEQWHPQFLHPQPPRDIQGSVFTVAHGAHQSVWVNTIFDLAAGRMQYVAFLPGKFVETVDVRLTALTPRSTSVEVTYVRTALDASANHEVRAMAERDAGSGPRWQAAIERCLAK